MTFEYFNTSSLAFGSKITAAFRQLENNMTYAINSVDAILGDLEFYQQFITKNYRVPAPIRATMAARTNELYAIVDDMNKINYLSFNDNTLFATILYYNPTNHRITRATGSTTIREGYAYVSPSPSNTKLTRTIRFSSSSTAQGNEILLFQYRVDPEGRIFLVGDLRTSLKLYPQDATQYKSLSKGDGITLPYTANDYECLCIVGHRNFLDVQVNGETIIKGDGGGAYDNINHAIIYVKKGDVVSGSAQFAFKVRYNT